MRRYKSVTNLHDTHREKRLKMFFILLI